MTCIEKVLCTENHCVLILTVLEMDVHVTVLKMQVIRHQVLVCGHCTLQVLVILFTLQVLVGIHALQVLLLDTSCLLA